MRKRAGQTTKLSISLADEDLAVLRRRAKRLFGGNLSAAVAETVRLMEIRDGQDVLSAWLYAKARPLTPEREAAIRAELGWE